MASMMRTTPCTKQIVHLETCINWPSIGGCLVIPFLAVIGHTGEVLCQAVAVGCIRCLEIGRNPAVLAARQKRSLLLRSVCHKAFETTARTTSTMSEPEARASCHDEYSENAEQGLELLRVAYIDGRTIGRTDARPTHASSRGKRIDTFLHPDKHV
jgi:hypothetical protein